MPDNDRDDDFVIADDGEIVFEDELPPLNEEAPLDIVDGHPELNVDDLTVDIVDDYGG